MNKLFTLFLSACFFGLNAQSVAIDSNSDERFDYSEKKEVKSFKGEVQTRPISLLQGVYTAGMEFKISQSTSILFDFGAGTSLFDESTLTTGMLGIRYYIGPEFLYALNYSWKEPAHQRHVPYFHPFYPQPASYY